MKSEPQVLLSAYELWKPETANPIGLCTCDASFRAALRALMDDYLRGQV